MANYKSTKFFNKINIYNKIIKLKYRKEDLARGGDIPEWW